MSIPARYTEERAASPLTPRLSPWDGQPIQPPCTVADQFQLTTLICSTVLRWLTLTRMLRGAPHA